MKIIMIPNMPTMSGRHYCIAKELVRQGHSVEYFMWSQPYGMSRRQLVNHLFTSLRSKQYAYEDFEVHPARRLPYFWPFINGLLFKYQLRKLFSAIDADIIISETYTNETDIPSDLPYIYDLADDYAGPADVYGSKIYKLAFKLLNVKGVMKRHTKNALAATVVSEALEEYATQYNDLVVRIPNGVETQFISQLKISKHKKKHSLVYATGFGSWSRAIETLDTVIRLRKEFPDIELTLLGDGTEVSTMRSFIAKHDASGYIHMLGYIYDRKQLYELISKSSIGLNVSDKNAWRDASHPMKVMDYSALGLKVVSTDLREVKALKYSNIFLFSDHEGSQLEDAIRTALLSSEDSYSAVSNEVLERHSWKKLTSQYIDLITKVTT